MFLEKKSTNISQTAITWPFCLAVIQIHVNSLKVLWIKQIMCNELLIKCLNILAAASFTYCNKVNTEMNYWKKKQQQITGGWVEQTFLSIIFGNKQYFTKCLWILIFVCLQCIYIYI